MDQPSPFHSDPFLLHQSLTFPDPTTSLGVQFYQPSHQQQLLTNTHFIGNDLQILDSSLPVDVLHNPTSQLKMPTATCSINQTAQSSTLAKATSKRRQQKKSKDSQEHEKKKKIDSKEGQTGYIHVRARRGEATDSHSIAERVEVVEGRLDQIRREKINEKMKTLQSIVPGCDKITGKALMLDEVINYVQFLQSEIQLLSSKLATVYPMYDYGAQYEECMLEPQYDDIITMQQQGPLSFQEQQMSCVTSQNSGETMWDLEDERQQLDDDLFAIINCNSFHYK